MSRGARYTLVLDDGGRSESLRPGQSADCTVRALSIVTRTPYDSVYDTLAAAGRKPCQGFESDDWIRRKRGRVFGGRFRAVSVRGLTVSTFAARYPKGRYLLETPDHVWACLSSVHHDMMRVKDQPLSGAWVWSTNGS